MRAIVGIGSNVEPRRNVESACQRLARDATVLALSRPWWTPAVGGPPDSPPFLNCAAVVETARRPVALRRWLQAIELDHRRIRTRDRSAPRTLDLDALVVDQGGGWAFLADLRRSRSTSCRCGTSCPTCSFRMAGRCGKPWTRTRCRRPCPGRMPGKAAGWKARSPCHAPSPAPATRVFPGSPLAASMPARSSRKTTSRKVKPSRGQALAPSPASSQHASLLRELGLEAGKPLPGASDGLTWAASGPSRSIRTPIDGSTLATVRDASAADYERVVARLQKGFVAWRTVPAPRRGELVRRWGELLRSHKDALGRLVSLETGKSLTEGKGEVQEMVDICDFAVGLSRTVGGKTLPSERQDHRMMEQWHPLGVVGVITAFNFPTAVYAWNAAIALVCGDTVLWKPSEKTPITAIVTQRMLEGLAKEMGHPGITGLVVGGPEIGRLLTADRRVPLVSATGSSRMGLQVGPAVAARMGRTILELGGNNAIVVAPSADQDLAVRAILFGAVGTAGQRCTSTRRVFLHKSLAKPVTDRLVKGYRQVKVGDPLDAKNQMGPVIDEAAARTFEQAVAEAKKQGGKVLHGGRRLPALGTCYVEPTLVQVEKGEGFTLAQEETFAPILYLFTYDRLEDALAWHNNVRQGLSSAIFTNDLREAEAFVGAAGSDCGIANVNLGTSGAEIGGAFGGEKDTGGGRESGSDAWKQYMRRQTTTINYGTELPLAQGVDFEL
jgi:aldehyde dehydrogenase (NAD+)